MKGMLQARTTGQQKEVARMLRMAGVPRFDVIRTADGVSAGLEIYGALSFDVLAEIVDFLRVGENARRRKARWSAMRSGVDGMWVSGDVVFLKGVKKEDAVNFIQSLVEFGYDVGVLMDEYEKSKKITI